ncbi:MAG: hypothetical protein CMH97_10210 [Oceanospirillaceae bacterium]|nr:hypothetical protein [Oceanospirillaceae bacterium]
MNFHFEAPWANPVFGFDGDARSVDAIKPGVRDILKIQYLERVYGSGSGPVDAWTKELFYENTWYFVGQWFSGEKSLLIMRGILNTVQDGSQLKGLNLFHPRVFESAIANYFDHSYGYKRYGKRPDYRAPLNWKVLQLSESIQGVQFDLHYIANGGKDNPELVRVVAFPVNSSQFVIIYFDMKVLILDDEITTKPTIALCDSIIDSMRLKVGKKTLSEWENVKENCPDMSLSETMGEYQWPLFEEKPSKKPKERDITSMHGQDWIENKS